MSRRAQSTMEYAVFTAVVAAALMAMSVYVQRSIQANLKAVEDQINAEAIQPTQPPPTTPPPIPPTPPPTKPKPIPPTTPVKP